MSIRALTSSLNSHRSLRPHTFWKKRAWSSITPTQTGITIHSLNNTTFPYIWLRDSCQSPSGVHPSTKQKLHKTSDISTDIKPISLDQRGIRINESGGLEIDWIDGHKSIFSRSFLEVHSDEKKLHRFHHDLTRTTWDNESIQQSNLFIPYGSIYTPSGLLRAIDQLVQYGLVFVTGVPNQDTGDETCELRKLGETLGDLRPTFYGMVWDVMNKKESKNIAYTNLDLGLHMDLLYFQHPPRYQILHCLRNRVEGGTSLFVDALAAAETLRQTHPDYFDTLASSPVAFHYINDGHHLHYEHPTIELASLSLSPGSSSFKSSERQISHINYSPPFQAPLPLHTPTIFYSALKEFSKVLNDTRRAYTYTLKEGDAVLFDNRRVLHARTAFYDRESRDGTSELKEGEPNRWLKGCYLEADAIMDRRRVLKSNRNSLTHNFTGLSTKF